MYSFLFHAIRRAVQRDISGFAVLYCCHDELGIDLSENYPNCIVDKIAPPNVISPTPLISGIVAFTWIAQDGFWGDDLRQLVIWLF
jgi:hypothetical protein